MGLDSFRLPPLLLLLPVVMRLLLPLPRMPGLLLGLLLGLLPGLLLGQVLGLLPGLLLG